MGSNDHTCEAIFCVVATIVVVIVAIIASPVVVTQSDQCTLPSDTLYPGEHALCVPKPGGYSHAVVSIAGAARGHAAAYLLDESPASDAARGTNRTFDLAHTTLPASRDDVVLARALLLPGARLTLAFASDAPASVLVLTDAMHRARASVAPWAPLWVRHAARNFSATLDITAAYEAGLYWVIGYAGASEQQQQQDVLLAGTVVAHVVPYDVRRFRRDVCEGDAAHGTWGWCEFGAVDNTAYVVVALDAAAPGNVSVAIRLGYSLLTRTAVYIALGVFILCVLACIGGCVWWLKFDCARPKGKCCRCCHRHHLDTRPTPPSSSYRGPDPLPASVELAAASSGGGGGGGGGDGVPDEVRQMNALYGSSSASTTAAVYGPPDGTPAPAPAPPPVPYMPNDIGASAPPVPLDLPPPPEYTPSAPPALMPC